MKTIKIVLMIPIMMIMMYQSTVIVYGKDISDDPSLDIYSVAGVLNLQEVDDIHETQMIPLHGEWEFYWGQLLEPDALHKANLNRSYMDVPSSWGDKSATSAAEAKFGYGTYKLEVKVPVEHIGKSRAIYVESIGSAYRLWINGEEQSGLGVVGTSLEEETPQDHYNLIFIEPKQEMMEIVIQISNFSFREGGIIGEIFYGDTKALNVYLMKGMFSDIFIIGGFALISLYHFFVYGFRRKNTLTLFLGFLTLMLSARTLFLNGYLSSVILGMDSWELKTGLEYISENIAFLFVVLLMKHMYPQEIHRYMLYISYGVVASLSLFVLLTPARIYTETMLLQTSVKAVVLLYFVCYVGVVAFARRREGAFINLVAILIGTAGIVNDMLYYGRLIQTFEMFNYSAVIFVLAQAVVVSYRYARLSHKNDTLLVELGNMNITLEQKVEVRTQRLHSLNEELSQMKTHRTKMLVNIAHDLHSPMTGIQTYLYLMDKGLLPARQQEITRQLMEKTDYIQRLIRDLFDLSKLETKEQAFDVEKVAVEEWAIEVYNHFKGDLLKDNFNFQQGNWQTTLDDKDVYIHIDRFRMKQVLQNYVENAVKFSRDRRDIIMMNVFLSRHEGESNSELVVEIVDYGEGIPEEQLSQVYDRFYKKWEGNAGGSGLGLAIVAEIIEQHRGTVGVRSELGVGSTFYFRLPVIPNVTQAHSPSA